MKLLIRSACLFLTFLAGVVRADVTLDLGTAKLRLDDGGVALGLVFADGTRWPGSGQPVFVLEESGASHLARSATRSGDLLQVAFDDGSTASFRLTEKPGMVLLRLESLKARGPVERFRLFRLAVPEGARIGGTLNAGFAGDKVAAVMAAEPNVEAHTGGSGAVAPTGRAARIVSRGRTRLVSAGRPPGSRPPPTRSRAAGAFRGEPSSGRSTLPGARRSGHGSTVMARASSSRSSSSTAKVVIATTMCRLTSPVGSR